MKKIILTAVLAMIACIGYSQPLTIKNGGTPASDLTVINVWGDSRAQGVTNPATSPGGDYPFEPILASLTGLTVNNYGIGGQTSAQILTRVLGQTTAQKNQMQIFIAGRNDLTTGDSTQFAALKANIASMIASIPHDSYILMIEYPSSYEVASDYTFYSNFMRYSAEMKALYGKHCFDVLAYMQNLSNNTTADNNTITQGIIPAHLTFDSIHFSNAGYTAFAKGIYDMIDVLTYQPKLLTTDVIRDEIQKSVFQIGSRQRNDGYFSNVHTRQLSLESNGFLRQGNNITFKYDPNSQSIYVGRFAGQITQLSGAVNANTIVGDGAGQNGNLKYSSVIGWSNLQNASGNFITSLGWNNNGLTTASNVLAIGSNLTVPNENHTVTIANLIFGKNASGTGETLAGQVGIGVRPYGDAKLELPMSTTLLDGGIKMGDVYFFRSAPNMMDFGGSINIYNTAYANSLGITTNGTFGGNVTVNGSLGIGTANTQGAMLAVNGTIHTKEVKVVMTGWPDYVFAPSYKRLGLEETEQFIKEKKHLPEIPSAAEVAKNGVKLGDMSAKLLQKIEELTLYMIDVNKSVKKLKRENQLLKRKVARLENNK